MHVKVNPNGVVYFSALQCHLYWHSYKLVTAKNC